MKAGEVELRENPEATDWGCCVGEESGELLARDERSEAEEMETNCCMAKSEKKGEEWHEEAGLLTSLSVKRPGQNSRSSSSSKDRMASNFERKAESAAVSLSSFMLRTPRNCLWGFCETERRAARRLRPP